jgi:nucleoside-diphosphate-sugar epimerase
LKISTALVTGGAGFVGSHLVDELVRRNIDTYVIDNFSTGSIQNLDKCDKNLLHVLRGELREIPNLMPKNVNIDVVFHEAAIASVPRSVNDPETVHDVNVNMSLDLMNFCVKREIKKFIFASSAAVYGVLGNKIARELLLCKPTSPYGAGKFCVETYLRAYQNTFGLEPVMLRYFNIYGPRQKMSDYSGVITIFARSLSEGVPVTIHGDGLQTRDFVNVRDIVQANILAMESDKVAGEIFNVATGHTTTILGLFEILGQIIGKEVRPKFAPPRPGDLREGNASIRKIQDVLGYKPSVPLKEGLIDLVNYTRQTEVSGIPEIVKV